MHCHSSLSRWLPFCIYCTLCQGGDCYVTVRTFYKEGAQYWEEWCEGIWSNWQLLLAPPPSDLTITQSFGMYRIRCGYTSHLILVSSPAHHTPLPMRQNHMPWGSFIIIIINTNDQHVCFLSFINCSDGLCDSQQPKQVKSDNGGGSIGRAK